MAFALETAFLCRMTQAQQPVPGWQVTAMRAFLRRCHCRGSGLLSVRLPVPLFRLSGGPALDTRRTNPAGKQHADAQSNASALHLQAMGSHSKPASNSMQKLWGQASRCWTKTPASICLQCRPYEHTHVKQQAMQAKGSAVQCPAAQHLQRELPI